MNLDFKIQVISLETCTPSKIKLSHSFVYWICDSLGEKTHIFITQAVLASFLWQPIKLHWPIYWKFYPQLRDHGGRNDHMPTQIFNFHFVIRKQTSRFMGKYDFEYVVTTTAYICCASAHSDQVLCCPNTNLLGSV